VVTPCGICADIPPTSEIRAHSCLLFYTESYGILLTSDGITFISVAEIIPAVSELNYVNDRMVRHRDISCLHDCTLCK